MRRPLAAALVLSLPSLLPTPSAAASPPRIANEGLYAKSLEAASQAIEAWGRYEHPEEQTRVDEIGYHLAQEADFQDFPYVFYLVDMPVPNAFALPGGQIFITRGMLDLGLTDDMLAGLLGHEIGHVVRQHGMRMQRKANLLNVLSQAILVGVAIGASNGGRSGVPGPDPYGRTSSGSVVEGTMAAGIVVSELLLRSYSRNFEDEADEEGQRLAAAAGFDPEGTRQLMAKMEARIPQTKEYGYWRTHPFFDERVRAAAIRQDHFTVGESREADGYRQATQELLLGYASGLEDPERVDLLRHDALRAWPQGPAAEEIRLQDLHRAREAELGKPLLSRNYSALIARYEAQRETVGALTPESPFLDRVEEEVADFERRRQAVYEPALEVLEGGVWETDFLETFLSNFPHSSEAPEVSLALGEAYSRLGRQVEAAEAFLGAAEEAPESESGQRARSGLKVLAGTLSHLAALQRLAQQPDTELAAVATERLRALASRYEQLSNGADFLTRYPEAELAEEVTTRLYSLAEDLYGEVVLYQTVGDDAKAVRGIQQILEYAPHSPAAEKLRASMVLES